ncbi:MAG: AraC family transcriptional regulator [Victivallales bacterium]|nr:AraC family transcriptional regulator [Victivallales bacterium]
MMINDTSMLKIIFLEKGLKTLDKSWRGQSFKEQYSRLYCVIEGSAEIWHSSKKFDLVPGKLFLIPANSNMRHRCKDSCRIAWIHFNVFLYGHLDILAVHPFIMEYSIGESSAVPQEMSRMIGLIGSSDISGQLQAKSILFDLLSNFFVHRPPDKSFDTILAQRFKPVLDYIEIHCHENISSRRLAEIASYEPTYFSTLFKKTFSISPKKYATVKRIEKAQAMLSTTDVKILAVAQETGFSDAFHFSKTFKKITGLAPSQFRKKFPTPTP